MNEKKETLIITEIGQAHEGCLNLAHAYIDAVAKSGADVIKFQTHVAEAESSIYEPFRVKMNTQDKTRYDYWKRMEFTLEQWGEIKAHSEKVGLEFMSTPFSNAAVDLLEEIGVQRYKVGSGEVTNFLILKRIAETGKDIILSTGMSNIAEIDEAINFLRPMGNKISLLQCSTKYPTGPEDIGLNMIRELKEKYQVPVGLSDHSGTIYPSIAAVALGTEIVEVHVTFDKKSSNPDVTASLTMEELRVMVEGVRFVEKMMVHQIDKNDHSQYQEVKKIFEKSLAVNKALEKGQEITFGDLEGKKPSGHGIAAKEYRRIIGKKLNRSKNKYDFLKEEDFL